MKPEFGQINRPETIGDDDGRMQIIARSPTLFLLGAVLAALPAFVPVAPAAAQTATLQSGGIAGNAAGLSLEDPPSAAAQQVDPHDKDAMPRLCAATRHAEGHALRRK